MTPARALPRLILLSIALIITGCSSRTPAPTAPPTGLPASPTASSTPVQLTQTAAASRTPTSLPPTLTPTPAEPLPSATPEFQRPTFGEANAAQLQFLAQWSTGQVDSQYTWSPDGSRLLLVSAPVARLIDTQTFQQLWEAPGGASGAFSEDGDRVSIQRGNTPQVYSAADGKVDASGQPFAAAAQEPMIQPVSSFTTGFDPQTARSISWLSMAIQEDGAHRQLRFLLPESGCPTTVYPDLPPGITGYSFSPDNRLLLITAKGTNTEPNHQVVILGYNSGFEPPLPSQPQGLPQSGFHPTRPGLGIPQLLPILYSPPVGQNHYPPPIDPPTGPLDAYRLKPWSEEAGLAMLHPLIKYATANDVFGPASGRSSFYRAQEPLRLAALEYLARFPQSSNRAAAGWRLALSSSIFGLNETDDWIASQLEQAINQQPLPLQPLSLNAALVPFGFYVDTSPFPPAKTPFQFESSKCDPKAQLPKPILVHNLFGDGRQSQLIVVKTIGSTVGLVVAVHQQADGHYLVKSVGGAWSLESGVFQELDAIDITGDGRPEVRVDSYFHSGSMSSSSTGFYQWQGQGPGEGKFIEISGGIYFDTEFGPAELEIVGAPGVPKTLVAHKHGVMLFDAIQTLKWNGNRFISSRSIPFPLDPNYVDEKEAYLDALLNGQYEEIINQIHALSFDPRRTFLLGYVEALQFHPEHARAAFQTLVGQAKTGASNDLTSAAQAFLMAYQDGTDLYRACQAALRLNQNAPCGTDLAFQSLLERLANQPASDLPWMLESYGISFSVQTSLDANGDRRTDWLLVEGGNPTKELVAYDPQVWLVIANAKGYQVQALEMGHTYDEGPYELTSLQLPGSGIEQPLQTFLLKQGKHALFFRVRKEGSKWINEHLLEDWNLSTYQTKDEDGSMQLILFHNTKNFDPPEIARWNKESGTFEKKDYLEYLLLTAGRADEALQMIPGLLDQVKANPGEDGCTLAVYGPRLQYFLGLAYELSGDSENAARTYYEIWKNHPLRAPDYAGQPDQPYAIMAREKLEQIKP